MILTGQEIHNQYIQNNINIIPYNKEQINPNSYDFRLSDTLKIYRNNILDPKVKQDVDEIKMNKEEGYILKPGKIYLACTEEKMGSKKFIPIIRAKSSIARMGLFIHITADLIDIGSFNQWTLQLHAVQPVKIFPGMLIGQVTFWEPKGQITLYDGKYNGLMGPQPSQIYKDFQRGDKNR